MALPAKSNSITQEKAETLLKKAHVRIMRHKETSIYAGIFLLGESRVVDNVQTARTDGRDKEYGREFIGQCKIEELCGLVLHENLHVMLKHIPRFRNLMLGGDPYIQIAMDLAVNSFIMDEISDRSLAVLPKGGAYDKKYMGWSVDEIRRDLMKRFPPPPQPQGGGKGPKGQSQGQNKSDGNQQGQGENSDGDGDQPNKQKAKQPHGLPKELSETLDEHDCQGMQEMTPQQWKELGDEIQEALQQGAMLAGRNKGGVPRLIGDALVPEVDWKEETQEFVSASMRGMDEFTWRKFNHRRLADDYYLPSTESETVEEVITALDTSGSISQHVLSEWAEHLANVCEAVKPQKVRVLWWDTDVHGEQIFEPGQYDALKSLLKPAGGGGTHAGCVARYIEHQKINASCVIVLTDGYTEQPIKWDIDIPTLWLVTENRSFKSPRGQRIVQFKSKF